MLYGNLTGHICCDTAAPLCAPWYFSFPIDLFSILFIFYGYLDLIVTHVYRFIITLR